MPPEKPITDQGSEPSGELALRYRALLAFAGLLLVGVVGWVYLGRPTPPPEPAETSTPAQTAARFTAVEGSVKVKTVGSFEWVDAKVATRLQKNDLVRTASGGSAEITFFDGTVVQVRPDSLITIEESSEDPLTKRRRVAVKMESGEVEYQTGRFNVQGSSAEVATPTLRVRQGEMAAGGVRVSESGDSDVRQFRGTGHVETTAGEEIELGSREALAVDATGTAGPKRSLPGSPRLLAPPHQAEISYPKLAAATTLLAWEPVTEAVSYHVMLDYTPFFNRPLVDQRSVGRSSWELTGLEAGEYYWRVAAENAEQEEGAFSESAQFAIVRSEPRAAAPPPLSVETLDVRMNILQVAGRTAAGATVTINGQEVEVRGDGRFAEFLTLQGAGEQEVVIRAVGPDGGVNEERHSVMVAN